MLPLPAQGLGRAGLVVVVLVVVMVLVASVGSRAGLSSLTLLSSSGLTAEQKEHVSVALQLTFIL